MKKLILLSCFIASAFLTEAQVNGWVKGKLIDTAAKQPLTEATVSVMLIKDSSLVSFIIFDKKGIFEIPDLDAGDYHLMISYKGYENFQKKFSITAE